MLSLMQQLTVKLEEDTDLKLAYLIEAVQALLGNPADSSAQKYIPKWVCTPPSLSRPPALTRQCFYHTPPLFRGSPSAPHAHTCFPSQLLRLRSCFGNCLCYEYIGNACNAPRTATFDSTPHGYIIISLVGQCTRCR